MPEIQNPPAPNKGRHMPIGGLTVMHSIPAAI